MAMLVAQKLDFDMTGWVDDFLDIEILVTVDRLGFVLSLQEEGFKILRIFHPAHTLTAPTVGCLDNQGEANLLGDGMGFF